MEGTAEVVKNEKVDVTVTPHYDGSEIRSGIQQSKDEIESVKPEITP